MRSIFKLHEAISDSFIEHAKSSINDLKKEDAVEYNKFLLDRILNIRKIKNRTALMLITIVLIQAIYVSGSSVEVSIISIKISDPIWSYSMLFVASNLIAMLFLLQHMYCLSLLTIAEISIGKYHSRGWLYVFSASDSNVCVGYLSYLNEAKIGRLILWTYKASIFVFGVISAITYQLVQIKTISSFLSHIRENHPLLILSICFIFIVDVLLLALTTLTIGQHSSRRASRIGVFQKSSLTSGLRQPQKGLDKVNVTPPSPTATQTTTTTSAPSRRHSARRP